MKNTTQHTPGPWKVGSRADLLLFVMDVDGSILADNISDIHDANRIVACVNACDGIPTDRLEFHLSENVKLHDLLKRGAQHKMRADALVKQRDDLLAALESVRAAINFDSRDWSENKTDAWLFSILVGWSDAFDEVCRLHKFDYETKKRLSKLSEAFDKAKGGDEKLSDVNHINAT